MNLLRTALVLGAGTEIGKTYVSAAILSAARAGGLSVNACKPLMSGFDVDDLIHSDAGILLNACGLDATTENIDTICAYRFTEAVSPNIAARATRTVIEPYIIRALIEKQCAAPSIDLTIIEGAGGVLSPLTDTLTQADFFATLGVPAVLITTNYLGAISHTLSAVETLTARKIDIRAIVVSQPQHDLPAPDGLSGELARYVNVPIIEAPFDFPPLQLGRQILPRLCDDK